MLPLFVSDAPLHCINEAAIEFHIPAKLIISILNIQQGRVGQSVLNKDGTYDLGPLQINSKWLSELNRFAITREDLLHNPCINIKIGSWILAKSIASGKNFHSGIGDYHFHTLRFNLRYSAKVKISYTNLNIFLSKETFNEGKINYIPV